MPNTKKKDRSMAEDQEKAQDMTTTRQIKPKLRIPEGENEVKDTRQTEEDNGRGKKMKTKIKAKTKAQTKQKRKS